VRENGLFPLKQLVDFFHASKELTIRSQLEFLKKQYDLELNTITNITVCAGRETAGTGTITLTYALDVIGVYGEVDAQFIMDDKRKFKVNLVELEMDLFIRLYASVIMRSEDFQIMINAYEVNRQLTKDYNLPSPAGILTEQEFTKIDKELELKQVNLGGDSLEQWDMFKAQLEKKNDRYEKQGDTTSDIASPLPPTMPNMIMTIMTLYVRYQEQPYFNARMALHEMKQQIDTVVLDVTSEQNETGDPFICEFKFTVDNPVFSPLFGHGTAKRKRDAEEMAAVIILEELYSRIPPADTHSKKPECKDIEPYNTEPKKPVVTVQQIELFFLDYFKKYGKDAMHAARYLLTDNEPAFFLRSYFSINEKLRGFGFRLSVETKTHKMVNTITQIVYRFIPTDCKKQPITHTFTGHQEEGEDFQESKLRLLEESWTSAIWTFFVEARLISGIVDFELDDLMDCE